MRNLLLFLFIIICEISFSQTGVSVLTQHNDLKRTGWNNNETVLNQVQLASGKFGCIATWSVDDEVYAQPLLVNNISIGNYSGSVVYVATVNNSVYAFNANDVSQGAALWQVNLNPAGQRTPNIFDLKDPQQGMPCGGNYRDFSGRFGIVGTPVIDTISKTLYVATKTIDSNGVFYSYINAIDLQTGLNKSGSPHLVVAQVNGTGDGNVNGIIQYQAKYQNQRSALLLYNNTVYVATASHCDWGPYHGWILGFDNTTLNLKYTYNATPNGWAGGIWMSGQGISVGDDGNLYVATGNGTTTADNSNLSTGRSESLIKLTPQLNVLDWFTPSNYNYLDQADLDFGSDGTLIIPNSTITVSGSKEGLSYVVDYNNMGRYNATNVQVKDTMIFYPNNPGYAIFHGSPVYANLNNGEYVYGWAENYKLRQFKIDRTLPSFFSNYKEGNYTMNGGMPGAMLSVSSNGADSSSAIIWACYPSSGSSNNEVRPGTIAAYAANNVAVGELWKSDNNINDVVGKFAKFNAATVSNGKVFVPTFSNAIKVYGLICNGALTNLQYANGTGLKAEYYSNSSSSSGFNVAPSLIQVDNNINFNWGTGSPASGISKNIFKVRWTGTIKSLTDDNYTIYLTASDGVRLWINNVLLIDSWADKTFTTHTATIALQKANNYDIRLEYYSNTNPSSCILQWSATDICKQIIPSMQLFPATSRCSSNGTGLLAEYFSNVAPTDPFPATATVTKVEPLIYFDWGTGSPAGISNDNFKARFTGYVQSLDSGLYTFYVTADDGIRLWVNNQLLVDKWIDQGATEYSASIALPECTKNAIKIEYYEHGGLAVCKLEWSGPTVGKQPVPTAQLFTSADVPSNNFEFNIYPNPNSIQSLTVSLNIPFQLGDQLLIYNLLGQLVAQNLIGSASQGTLFSFPINLPGGVYVIKLVRGNKWYSSKFIVK